MIRPAAYITAALLLHGCALGPDYTREDHAQDMPENYIHGAPPEAKAQPMATWWERINDPLLNQYVEVLLADNLTLKQAGERLVQATQRVRSARADYYPTIGLEGSNTNSFSAPNALGKRTYSDSLAANATTSWQIDVFGKIGRTVESNIALAEASAFDKEAITQSLIATLTRARVAVATNAHLLKWAQETSANRASSYELVKRRYDLGAQSTGLADVYLAQENATTVRSDVHEYERTLTAERYALDVLLGKMPGTTSADSTAFPLLPPARDVPVCLPASLLDRRPDLRVSELRLAAATADIGVAIADLYPSFSLGGLIGVTGSSGSNLFSSDNLAGSLFQNIMLRVFEGGALRANIQIQESEARELAAAYAEDILNAVREVETALQAERALFQEVGELTKSVEALRNAESLSEQRYKNGIESLSDYLDTQRRRYTTEQQWLLTQQQAWNARIDLYLALGGDWFDANNNALSCTQTEADHES